ncbi:MAG: hypothetical protein QN172_06185 [Armatimonadota bacterium]|nr:hypothetical protein [Armatimonadota bacterium]MDR7438490.1 hypothetical protein [Armatimonadota bacterium]MDR7567563.1 hypothetical protein [Armatimonadota bacterium]MDR7602032.1 hypothetical protein [Armatimonadota bacterium]
MRIRAKVWMGVGGGLVFVAGVVLGLTLARTGHSPAMAQALLVQAPLVQELVPLPGPGRQFPGQQPQPGEGSQECEGKVYLFYNGRFYEMRPGPRGDRNGLPSGPQEFYPLQPAPFAPRLPVPGQRF